MFKGSEFVPSAAPLSLMLVACHVMTSSHAIKNTNMYSLLSAGNKS